MHKDKRSTCLKNNVTPVKQNGLSKNKMVMQTSTPKALCNNSTTRTNNTSDSSLKIGVKRGSPDDDHSESSKFEKSSMLKKQKQDCDKGTCGNQPSNYSFLLDDQLNEYFENVRDEDLYPCISPKSIKIDDWNESTVDLFCDNTANVEETDKSLVLCDDLALLKDECLNGMSRLLESADWTQEKTLTEQNKSTNLSSAHSLKNISLTSEFTTVKQDQQNSMWPDLTQNWQTPILKTGPFFGMPSEVKQMLIETKGIKDLYDWQEECLNLKAVKTRTNLVYALPTSGGKTLVAEILILQEIMCRKKNVLFVLPFVSIVQEKVRGLSGLALSLGFLVEEYAAGKGIIPPKKRHAKNSVIIATIEKALAVVLSLIELGRLGEIGLVVVDELHLLGEDSGRGATFEQLLTHIIFSKEKIHLIGMSATIGNLPEIAQFLNAETYSRDFRPVELVEYVKCGKEIFKIVPRNPEILVLNRTLSSQHPPTDPDGITDLVSEIIPKESVLVFCSTKKNCENVALLLCKHLPDSLQTYRPDDKKQLLDQLAGGSNEGKLCPLLSRSIPFGVAYHHSGLTTDERRSLEDAFRDGVLNVMCCTSTLAAGVNLPARRVLLRAPYVARDFITLARYKQMVGRAGRAGLSGKYPGESFLICQPNECVKVGALLRSKMEDTTSQMREDSCRSLILSAISLRIANTRESLRNLLRQTLLHVQADRLNVDILKITDQCLKKLYKDGGIRVANNTKQTPDDVSKLDITTAANRVKTTAKSNNSVSIENNDELSVTRLGQAAIKGCMSLETAQRLYGDLIKAQNNLVLICHLHLLYIVTPYDMAEQVKPNYSVYFDVFSQLGSKELHTAQVIGITEKSIMKMITGQKSKFVSDNILKRFYLTLILNEMWKQRGVWDVANLFQVQRGFVQALMSSAATFSSNVYHFCESLDELWCFKALFTDFAARLAHCCEPELLPLMDLPAIKKARAKQLFNVGFKTLRSIAQSDPKTLVSSITNLSLKTAKQIIDAANLQLLEKAENFKDDAADVLECIKKNNINSHTLI